MTTLFRRRCRVTIYNASPPTSAGFVGAHPQYFTPQPNGIAIENLRVQFKIEKSLEKTPNKATVTITNCSPTTRQFLQTKPLVIKIECGYGDDLRTIFQGDIRYAYSKVVEADWETAIECNEGGRAYTNARVSRTYPKGTNVVTALRDAASSMGLDLPASVAASPELQAQFATGRTLHGKTRDEITRLLQPYGYHWSIQANKMQIVKDQDSAEGTAFLISQSSGLIESPEFTTPEKAGKPSELKIKTLLYPEIIPGVTIDLESLFISGFFRVNKVDHTGDTHGDDWTTEIEAIPKAGLVKR